MDFKDINKQLQDEFAKKIIFYVYSFGPALYEHWILPGNLYSSWKF